MPPAKDPDGTGPETLNSFLWWPGLRTWLIIFVDLEECWAQSDLSGTTSPSEHHHLLPRCMKYTILCHRYNFPPWAAIAFAFEVSHSTYKPSRKYDWLIAPWAVYSSLWGCSRRSFHSTNIINGGVFADTQFPPFSVSSASWNVFPASFFGWSLMFAASVSLLSSSFEGIGFSVV